MKKLIVIAVALVASASLPSAADAAYRSLNLTKNIAKAGSVVDADGQVDCGLDCTNDSGAYEVECDGEGMCLSPITSLTATPQTGWALQTWGGCTSTDGNTCHVTMNTDKPKEIIATFADVGDPTVAILAPAQHARLSGQLGFGATAADNDAVQRVDFFVNGVKVGSDTSAPYEQTIDTAQFPDGATTLRAQAFDPSGRASAGSERAVIFDNVAPTVQITGGTAENAILGPPASALFEFAAGDAGPVSAVECRLDDAPFAACQSITSHTFEHVAEGAHTFQLRARDAAGNTSPAVSRSFSVDLTAPDTVIESGRADGSASTDTDAAFTFSSEDGASFACRLYTFGAPAPAFGACSAGGTHSVSGLAAGTYVFEVRAIDAVGNADPTPAARTFAVTAPAGGGEEEREQDPRTEPTAEPTPQPTPVATPVATVTPPPAAERITSGFTWKWNRRGTRTTPLVLSVGDVPAGATVELRCKGRGCPFKVRSFAGRKGTIKLARAFKRRRVAAGGTVEVRVTKPGMIGRVVVFKMRRGALPTYRVRCLAPGAAKPAAC